MKFHYHNDITLGDLYLISNDADFDRIYFNRDNKNKVLTIAWNKGPMQIITIDEIPYEFPGQSVLPLMVSDSFRFENSEHIVAWQFSRSFYCIADHDKEVSCVGFLFYGLAQLMFISLDEQEQLKLEKLLQVFIDEFNTSDNIQHDMLLILLKRLIIIITRLGKKQYIDSGNLNDNKLDIIRQYNLLVENYYRKEHSVQFYAGKLNKSPKTLANLFALYNNNSPLTVIQERVVREAQRLLIYTEKSSKEIAYELGFEDAAYFNNFFKKHTSYSPLNFRKKKIFSFSGQ